MNFMNSYIQLCSVFRNLKIQIISQGILKYFVLFLNYFIAIHHRYLNISRITPPIIIIVFVFKLSINF